MKNVLFLMLALACAPVRAAGLLATLSNPVSVVFNNDYKGLVSENEKIVAEDPRAPEKFVKEFVASAKKTLDVCVYDVSDPGMAAAMMAAKDRGVKVRIVTEQDNTMERDVPGKTRDSIEQLRSAGIPLLTDGRSGLMHCKFVIVDDAAVWFGSMNWTRNALFRDNNNSVFVRSPAVAAVFKEQFERFFTKKEFTPGAVVSEKPIRVGDAEMTIHFSPQAGSQAAILAAVGKATNSIRFMMFTFTDRDVGNLLTKKRRDGLTVEGVFDTCQIDRYSEYKWLTSHGVKTWQDGNQALLHHKVMLVDDSTVICGSYNFTKSAEKNNNEVMVIIRCPRLAKEFHGEFDRLVYAAEHNGPLPPYDHPACEERSPTKKPDQPLPR